MSPEIVAEIKLKLDEVEIAENVVIPLAIESGSRAWGFPSPDSDYDCRFVYLRKTEDLLSLFPKRDVIETPLTPIFDINGWELAKAIKLMLKGNAVIIEWLQSPISYRCDEGFHAQMLAFSEHIFQRDAVALHYLHLLRSTYQRHAEGNSDLAIKKLFYILRPAMALAYMRENDRITTVPMNFQHLCNGVKLPGELQELISELLERKSVTRELGTAAAPKEAIDFALRQMETAESWITPQRKANNKAEADQFYQDMLQEFGK